MKSYRERTNTVLEKIRSYEGGQNSVVENGGQTLALKHKKNTIIWCAFAAVCIAIIIVFNLVLFLPYPINDISAYSDSEYYGLISVVNRLTYRAPYKNNFEKWTSNWRWGNVVESPDIGDANDALPPTSPGQLESTAYPDSSSESSSGNGQYVENTNNQVKAVTEADLLKRSTSYAFYLDLSGSYIKLLSYRLSGESTTLISSYEIKNDEDSYFYEYSCEGYLSADCNTVTVICECYNYKLKELYTCIINLDVSDVKTVKESGRIYVSGRYISSRLVDGNLLMFTNYNLKYNPDFSNEANFVPQTGTLDSLNSIPIENIVYSEDATSARYTVVCSIDQGSLDINSNFAFLSFSQSVYVSESNIFLTRTKNNVSSDDDTYYDTTTEINCVSYANGELEFVNSATVPGFVLNQYSMDEYEGILRVVTEYSILKKNGRDYSGASLFCIDLDSFEICASLKEFCPDGESVRSVRFDRTTAYVCTAVALKDPVFAIDLSDLNNITYKDTGTIPGYSLSLMKFTGDTLLGIGYGDSWNLKIELYEQTADGVESVAVFEKNCSFSTEFKAYFIDAENGFIGLTVSYYDDNYKWVHEFIVLLYDGYDLNQIASVRYDEYVNRDYTRAFMDDGFIYVFSYEHVDVIALFK